MQPTNKIRETGDGNVIVVGPAGTVAIVSAVSGAFFAGDAWRSFFA